MAETLCIYAPFDTPRLRYALDIVFRHILSTGYLFTTKREAYSAHAGPRLSYSEKGVCSPELRIPCGTFLCDTGIQAQDIRVENRGGLPAFFFTRHSGATYDFDLFSLVFYLVSRYEEYLPCERDTHGRFPAHQSVAWRHNFLDQPLVNRWVLHLASQLEACFSGFRIERPLFRFQPTFDVDQAWAYRYKNSRLQWGGILRDALHGDWAALRLRREVMAGRAEDPFFTFADIEEWHRNPKSDPIFFFHLGDIGRFDKSISHRQPMLRTLITRLAGAHLTGIHPSWLAADNTARLAEEIRRYSEITGAAPLRSRQHFLRMKLPRTYRQLIAAGICEDYTMGYPDMPGFRAGIAGPFPWYDLEAEAITELMVHPFTVMDVTLKKYLGLSPEGGLAKAAALFEAVRETGGVFCTLWHNSSFSEIGGWKPWRSMYIKLKEQAEAVK